MTGFQETARGKTRNATLLAVLLSGTYLFYELWEFRFFRGQVIAGRHGFFIEIMLALFLFTAGLLILNNGKKSGTLVLGGAMLWQLFPHAVMIMLPVPLTWVLARMIFKYRPYQTIWAGIIPLVACLAVWIGQQHWRAVLSGWLPRVENKFHEVLPTLTQARVTAPEGARLRAGPSTRAVTLGTIKFGEIITILGQEGEWYKARHRSAEQTRTGYIHTSLAKVEGNAPIRALSLPPEQESTALPPLAEIPDTSESSMQLAGRQPQYDLLPRTEEDENIDSGLALPSQHSLLGRWEGTLGDQLLLFVIDSFEDDHWLGYCEVRWTKSSPPLRMELQGRFNPATREVTLSQQQKGAVVGTFTGTISPEGNVMSGRWIFAEDS